MKNLLIIGARGFGREVYHLAYYAKAHGTEWNIKGFLDDNKNALDGFDSYPRIIDSVENYVPDENDVFICALGNIQYRKKYANIILEKGGKFINLFHATVNPHSSVKLGSGIIINDHCGISVDITIGDFTSISSQSIIGHDVKIGAWSNIGAACFIGGYTELKESVTVNVGSILIDRITIGENAVVGAGSVVIKNVPPDVTVFGNPARKVQF